MIEVEGVTHRFNKGNVIENIDLSIDKGEVFGLLGPSGSGKTTLVRSLIGMIEPISGIVRLRGQEMPKRTLMKRFGYMAQDNALYEELTAWENLDFFASFYLRKKRKKEYDMFSN